ncbi:MAG TPA: AAA family ATPase [Acidimicrobiales bacterium]|nr:AAA family ATPase [Acidimicrobiales bacterium]
MTFPKGWTATELLAAVFPDPKYVIPGIVPEGLTIVAGPPKVGKSWLAMNGAVAVGSGGKAFGRIPVEQGHVLYLALEDPGRRLQKRLRQVMAEGPTPTHLTFIPEWPRLDPIGLGMLEAWITAHPGVRMVIVDVFARIRPPADESTGIYASDYAALIPLKDIADRYGIAVVVIHHTRKQKADDFLDTLSGTQGIAGAADTVVTMERLRGSADAKLNVTGRDVEEASYPMSFNARLGLWTLLEGPAEDYELSETRRRIKAFLTATPDQPTKEIAAATGLDYEVVKKTCQRMASDGQLVTLGDGIYSVPGTGGDTSLLSPLSPDFTSSHALITNVVSPYGDRGDFGDRDTPAAVPCWDCHRPAVKIADDGWGLCEIHSLTTNPKGNP